MKPTNTNRFITLTPWDKDIDPHPHHVNVDWIKNYWADAKGRGTWMHMLGNGRAHKLIVNSEELYTEPVEVITQKIEQALNG